LLVAQSQDCLRKSCSLRQCHAKAATNDHRSSKIPEGHTGVEKEKKKMVSLSQKMV